MRYVWHDLSHAYLEDMPEASGHSPLRTEKVTNTNTGSRITNITINSHCGTHLDAPYHYVENGKTIDSFSPDFFSGLAVVLDIPKEEFEPVGYEDIKKNSELLEGLDFAFIRTGWEDQWGNDEYVWKYPYMSAEAANLLKTFKLRIVGTDTMSPDPSLRSGLRKGSPVHNIFLPNDILIIENLTGLKSLRGKIVEAFCFPLKVKGCDGSPSRVVARENVDKLKG